MKRYFFICSLCGEEFENDRHKAVFKRKRLKDLKGIYCSRDCMTLARGHKIGAIFECKTCGKSVYRQISDVENNKNVFCSRGCVAKHTNANKTFGDRRSKLERWIEGELIQFYPELEFHFNRKDAINSELDIYIPSLKLAFELNGPFHYEPIYGQEKLDKVQNNDHRKFQACGEAEISLCVIDTSKQKYFKSETSGNYLKIIRDIINQASQGRHK